jgi:hypothetical protein
LVRVAVLRLRYCFIYDGKDTWIVKGRRERERKTDIKAAYVLNSKFKNCRCRVLRRNT